MQINRNINVSILNMYKCKRYIYLEPPSTQISVGEPDF